MLNLLEGRLRRRARLGRPRPARERPPTRRFHPELCRAPTAVPAGEGFSLTGWHQQRAQAAEAVGAHEPERDQFGQRLLHLSAQQAGAFYQLVEK